jgi:hypothetical protein
LLFFAVMGAASAITLVRSYVFASLLTPDEFGRYASVVAAGAFCGIAISFGLVEKSLKAFPRLYAEGRAAALVDLSRDIERQIVRRAAFALPLAVAAGLVLPVLSMGEYAAVVVIAALVAACSAGASLLRAAANPAPLAAASLLRAVVAMMAGGVGAALLQMPGAIAGEMAGAVVFLGLIALRRRFFAQLALADGGAGDALTTTEIARQNWEGRILFLASLLATAPFYLDRLVVRSVVDAETLGRYGLLATLPLAASAFVSIVAQVIGPRLVHLAQEDETGRARLGVVTKAIGLSVALMLLLFSAGAWLVLDGKFAMLGAIYGLTWPLVALGIALALGQVSVLLDWLLIAFNREPQVLWSSAAYFSSATLSFLLFFFHFQSIFMMLLALSLSKVVHIALQIAFALISTGWNRPSR